MKNTLRIPGILNRAHSAKVPLLIIALAAVIGFTMTACPTDIDDKAKGGKKYLGDTLTLSGEVYHRDASTEDSVKYIKSISFAEEAITANGEGSGKTTFDETTFETKFSFTIKTPVSLSTFDFTDNMFSNWDDVKGDNSAVKCFIIFHLNKGVNNDGLFRENEVKKDSQTTGESVRYVYVDGDITITGKGSSYDDTHTNKDFNLALKKGWNAVYTRSDTSTTTMSLNNPNLKWVTRPVPPTSLNNPNLKWVAQ
jgi:hypothetical protein